MTALLPETDRPARLARVLTEELTAEATELDARWVAAVKTQFRLPIEETIRVLRAFAARADLGLMVTESARKLWAAADTPEPADEIAAAAEVFTRVGFQARKIEEHRTRPWTPKDPEWYARALHDVRNGRVYSAGEVREWLRRRASEGGA